MRYIIFLIFAIVVVSCRADVPPDRASPASDQASMERLDSAITDRLPIMMRAYGVDGMTVTVVSGQDTLLSEGYGVTKDGASYTADTPCPVYSATKVFTSLTIASLVEDGAFDVNSRLGEHLADAPVEWANIPFWRLLNHTSGITMIVNQPIFETLAKDPKIGNSDIYDFVRKYPLDYNPGEYSRYRQSGYGIAEMILSDRFGAAWPDLVAQHVTMPANAVRTIHLDTENVIRGKPLLASAGGFQTSANDMALIFKTLNRGEIVSPDFLEEWLYDATYDFDGYSLGSVLSEVGDVRTIGHSGGGRANLRYAPQKSVGIMVCTDDRSNNNIMHGAANMLMRELVTDEPTLMPIQTELLPRRKNGVAELVAFYQAEKSVTPQRFDFENVEQTLNQIGYGLLADDRTNDAITIFRLNTTENPSSPNAYDSLGEALFAAEQYDDALVNYRQVLALSPGNANATAMIEKIDAVNAE